MYAGVHLYRDFYAGFLCTMKTVLLQNLCLTMQKHGTEYTPSIIYSIRVYVNMNARETIIQPPESHQDVILPHVDEYVYGLLDSNLRECERERNDHSATRKPPGRDITSCERVRPYSRNCALYEIYESNNVTMLFAFTSIRIRMYVHYR